MLKKKKKDWMPSAGKKLKCFCLILIFINFDLLINAIKKRQINTGHFHDDLIMNREKIYLQTTFIHEVLFQYLTHSVQVLNKNNQC